MSLESEIVRVELDYATLRKQAEGRHYVRKFDPEVSKAREKDRRGRSAHARSRAVTALCIAFPDEYRQLYLAALEEVNAERGPLPGDEQ